MNDKYFPQEYLLELYSSLNNLQVTIWLDGGWGVDALLGKETRAHQDLDIVIQQKDLAVFCDLLKSRGYNEVNRDDMCAWNFVLGDNMGHEVDVHVINLDDDGNGIYGPMERGIFYPAEGLTGIGTINEIELRCLTADYQVESHTGYELKEKDFKDVHALCKKFNITLPQAYKA